MSRKLDYFYQIFQEYESMFLWCSVLPCRLDVHVMDLGIFCSWGFLKWKISLFCSCARCGTTGAFWMWFYYQNNLLSKNIFRCCSQAVGLSQKRVKRNSLQFWLYFFSPPLFVISDGTLWSFLLYSGFLDFPKSEIQNSCASRLTLPLYFFFKKKK